jgi:hypothetical protein
MGFCRFDDNRLGTMGGDYPFGVTGVMEIRRNYRWPLPSGQANPITNNAE